MMKPLSKMTTADLIEAHNTINRREPLSEWTAGRKALIEKIERLAPKPRENKPTTHRHVPYVRKQRVPRMKRRGVGKYICDLLSVVVGKCGVSDQYPVGLSYRDILDKTLAEYPESAADSLHIRWYAAKMRSEGFMIPVYRERSRWKKR